MITTMFSRTTSRRANKRKLKFVQANTPAKCFDNNGKLQILNYIVYFLCLYRIMAALSSQPSRLAYRCPILKIDFAETLIFLAQ